MANLSLSVQYASEAPDLPRWRLRGWVKRALSGAQTKLPYPLEEVVLTLRLVGLEEGLELNRAYRARDYATNVLTFNYDQPPGLVGLIQADIVICEPVLRKEAHDQRKTYLDHAAHLCIHATLHALGFDHETQSDAAIMESLETDILARMRIADPYLAHH